MSHTIGRSEKFWPMEVSSLFLFYYDLSLPWQDALALESSAFLKACLNQKQFFLETRHEGTEE